MAKVESLLNILKKFPVDDPDKCTKSGDVLEEVVRFLRYCA